jgi:hypothetical protein
VQEMKSSVKAGLKEEERKKKIRNHNFEGWDNLVTSCTTKGQSS